MVALTLNLLRRIKEMDARLRRGETIGSIYAMAPGLYGKTVGLVGMGDIAREVGRVLHVSDDMIRRLREGDRVADGGVRCVM